MNYFEKLCNIVNHSLFIELRYSYDEWNKKEWDYRIDTHPMTSSIKKSYQEAITECHDKLDSDLFCKNHYKEKLNNQQKEVFEKLISEICQTLEEDMIFRFSYGSYLEANVWIFKAEIYSFDRISECDYQAHDYNPIIALKKILNSL